MQHLSADSFKLLCKPMRPVRSPLLPDGRLSSECAEILL